MLVHPVQAAERRTAQAVADNAAIADEVEAMRTALERLQAESQKAASVASPRRATSSGSKVRRRSFPHPLAGITLISCRRRLAADANSSVLDAKGRCDSDWYCMVLLRVASRVCRRMYREPL